MIIFHYYLFDSSPNYSSRKSKVIKNIIKKKDKQKKVSTIFLNFDKFTYFKLYIKKYINNNSLNMNQIEYDITQFQFSNKIYSRES